MYKKALALAFIAALVSPLAAQTQKPAEKKADDTELRKESVAFLRETMSEVANMRTLENRISFSSELAGLMWYHDEAEAKAMFNSAIGDFRQLIAQLDSRLDALVPIDESDGPVGPIFADSSDRSRIMMKYRVAMAVRQQIATSIAEHDPDIALGFFYDTASTHPKAIEMNGRDSMFELNLLKEIAAKSPTKAVQYGMRSLENGLQYQHIDLLKKIAEKDHTMAVEFGAAMVKKATSESYKSYELYTLGSFVEFAAENFQEPRRPEGKKAIFSQADLRSLTDALAKSIAEYDSPDVGYRYVEIIEKYSPARGAQLRAKLRSESGQNLPNRRTNSYTVRSGSAPPPVYSGNAATNVAVSTGAYGSNTNSGLPPMEDPARVEQDRLMADIGKIGKGELPKEEQEKVIAQARKIMMQTRGKDKQIMGLSMLASQVARAGDKDLAAQIMRDAESLVNPNPKNYQDFLFTWMLAAGYAESDPDKAFPILEGAIGRANDLIHAFIRVGEFMDVTEEMISDGEAQVGAFGGGMIRGLSKELGIAEATISTLIRADFAKTRDLTNRFDRPEVRVLAKLLVLRSVMGKKGIAPSTEEQVKTAMDGVN